MGGGEASISSGHGRRLVTANVSRARRRQHSANTRVCRAAIQIRVVQFKFESRARSRSRDARAGWRAQRKAERNAHAVSRCCVRVSSRQRVYATIIISLFHA